MNLLEQFKVGQEDLAEWWQAGILPRLLAGALAVYLLASFVLAFSWSREPALLDLGVQLEQYANDSAESVVIGTATTVSLIHVAETMLDKPGGFLSNDITLPGAALDNIPSWEFGVLVQLRDLARAMREGFSRSQSQSTEDVDLAIAEPRFNFDNQSWILPRSEDEYRDGIRYIETYLNRLSQAEQSNAQFFSRADNLTLWLATVETRLGSLSQRLSASVGQRRLNIDLAGDAMARRSTAVSVDQEIKTPWHQIDNVLYESRGTTWALIHFLTAIQYDFADVLEKKNARVSLQQIIRELEATQQTIWSPVVLNGSGFGLFANHSLVMASYISRANAGIIDLRELLAKG
ncbi:MAG: hypothetical protein CL692_06615 [Cellvibrionales bacterium]|nr:hypothetical protein [Cellvibrionales bacterium]